MDLQLKIDELKQYLNGIYQGHVETMYYPTKPGFDLVIGGGFAGYIDDISIFNKALTDLEVAKLSGRFAAATSL